MIRLYFSTRQVVDPRFGNVPLPVIRLLGWIKFRSADGTFLPKVLAIVDSGAFLSTLPRAVWRDLEVEVDVDDVRFGGINDKPECQIPASLGRVRGFFVDEEGRHSRELTFPAFLAHTDQVPILLGFANLLDRFQVCFDYDRNDAYLEERTGLTPP